MEIKDNVIPTKKSGFILASGCEVYSVAVVASLDPFILISIEGDMLWSTTIKKDDFISISVADEKIWRKVKKRMKNRKT